MSLHALLSVTLLSSLALAATGFAAAKEPAAPPTKFRVYIGTYTGQASKGIYLSELDLASGQLSEPMLAAETNNPSFLAIHPNRKYLYAVSEISDFQGKKIGAVGAFAIDAQTGKLTELNRKSSGGGGPCHVTVDKTGQVVLVANYGGGSVSSLAIGADGSLSDPATTIKHQGKSVNPNRQEGPHAHSINVDPDNHFAFAADLGLDQVLIYKLDTSRATLEPNNPPAVSVAPGAGPRHFAFHPSGKYAFVINELDSTLTSLTYDAARGELKVLQTLSTLPEGGHKGNSTAEVVVHPSGHFVYGSNRGHDSIAVFQFDEKTGKLTAQGQTKIGGKTPRNFNVDPTGSILLACGQDSNSIHAFRIDPNSGALSPVGTAITVGRPVCVKFTTAP